MGLPKGFSHACHPVAELNSPEQLQAIADQYWPGLKDTTRLRVRRLQPAHYDKSCSRCGNTEYVLYAPRTYTVMCLTCRSLVFPRAGDPSLLAMLGLKQKEK